MILHGTSQRALTWAGLGALLGLAALVLPLLPTWAETPPRPSAVENRGGTRAAGSEGGASPGAKPNAPAGQRDSDSMDEARDEVDLLRVQTQENEAELQEAKALLDQARRQSERMQQLYKQGTAEAGALEQSRTQVEVLEARLRGKEAQLRESHLRLKQAERRLAAQQRGGEGPGGSGDKPAGLSPLAEPGNRGQRSERPVPGTAASPATPSVVDPLTVTTAPGSSPPVLVQPSSSYGSPGYPGAATSAEQRLSELEIKLAALSQEVEALRRELRPRRAAVPQPSYHVVPLPGPSAPPGENHDPRNTPTVPLTTR